MMICNAKSQPLNEEAKSGFTFGCCIRGLPMSSWYVRLWWTVIFIFVRQQVVNLMGVDLLRQAQKWKDGLMDIRQLMANLVTQVTIIHNF